ncbi:MAG TPA: sugar phosphate isomerase/epimerase [Terriglobia bacterium]|nr:sugar phosphate isomerase/epimerase [Terriglobia bacterium]
MVDAKPTEQPGVQLREMVSRREFTKWMLAGIPLSSSLTQGRRNPATLDSTIRGVPIGVHTFSYRSLSLANCLTAMKNSGLGVCELWAPHTEPNSRAQNRLGIGGVPKPGEVPKLPKIVFASDLPPDPNLAPRGALREWRLDTSLNSFKDVRNKFDSAGIIPITYDLNFTDDFTDDEIHKEFEIAKAFGVRGITTSSTVGVAKRLAPFANKHKVPVAFQFDSPETFATTMAMSPQFSIHLDAGDFLAAGHDPVPFIEANHQRIQAVRLRDRLKNGGRSVPWGDGDTPLRQVLQLLRDKSYGIPALIYFDYNGGNVISEINACFRYCLEALA